MDGPHVCQRCSTTFVLASSLRTHAAHIHGEGLKGFLADNSCLPNEETGYHGDTTFTIKLETVKREPCEADSVQADTLVTDTQTENVGDIRNKYCSVKSAINNSHTHDITTRDRKPSVMKSKTEVCDCEMDNGQPSISVTDTQAGVAVNNVFIKSGDHDLDDTACAIKLNLIKTEVYDCEVKCQQPTLSVTDTQSVVVGDNGIIKSENYYLDDIACARKSYMTKTELCDCKMDIVKPSISVKDTQVVSDCIHDTHRRDISVIRSGKHDDPARDIKPNSVQSETKLCYFDVKRKQPNISVTDIQTQVFSETHGSSVINNSGNHGDTVRDIKPNMIPPTFLMADKQTEVVGYIHDGYCSDKNATNDLDTRDFTTRDTKPNTLNIKTELCDCGVDSVQPNVSVTDLQKHDDIDVCGKNVIESSGNHDNATRDMKPTMTKIEVCDCEVDSGQPGISVTDAQVVQSNRAGPVEDKPQIMECTVNLSRHSGRQKHIQAADRHYVCRFCTMTFRSLSSLKAHKRVHAFDKPYVCSFCKTTFVSLSNLKRHIKVIHKAVRPYICEVCEKTFALRYMLKSHEQIHIRAKKRNYDCKFCKKACKNSSSLGKHEQIHRTDKPYLCTVCGKIFKTLKYLKSHERSHNEDQRYVCKVCEKSFPYSQSLKSHERVHTGDRPYVCAFCGKAFATVHYLKCHELGHSGARPFACTLCKKTFVRAEDLKKHERIHTGEKPCACKVCPKTFRCASNLKKHELTHTRERPYTCKECKMTFSTVGKFKIHERIHNIASPFSCTVCQSIFSCSSSLKKHERIHTGEKPYACKVCQKTDTYSSNLKKHESIHT